jgi:hypothetical protein
MRPARRMGHRLITAQSLDLAADILARIRSSKAQMAESEEELDAYRATMARMPEPMVGVEIKLRRRDNKMMVEAPHGHDPRQHLRPPEPD